MNFQKAVQFVREHGNETEQARLNYLLTGDLPSEKIKEQLFQGQGESEDGSPHNIHSTLEAIRALRPFESM
jgi:hypothetical protein